MQSPSELVNDLKTHLEHGAHLVESHIPGLVEWAQRLEADPLVAAAEAVVHLPAGVKALAAEFITKLAAEFPPPAEPAEPVVDDQGPVPV